MNHIGLNGLDPVAFLGHFQRTLGRPQFKHRYRGKTYFFLSQMNLEIFQHSPERFLPQFDGLCPLTYALTGKLLNGLADYPNVVGDKLYFHSRPHYAWICKLFPFLLRKAAGRYDRIIAELAA